MTAAAPLDLLADLLETAQRGGAETADAVFVESSALDVAQRLGISEKLERSESRDLGLRVLIGRRQAVASTTDFGSESLRALVERTVAMARAAPEDPYCGLADAASLAGPGPDLDICDDAEPDIGALARRAEEAEDAARAVPGVTNSEGAEAGWSRSVVALAATNGFARSYAVTAHGVSASVLAGEGVEMERDYDYDSAVHARDLRPAAEIGRTAGTRAVKRQGARKVGTAQVPVIYDRRVSGGLLRALAGAVNGSAVGRGTSFLKDRMDTRLFPEGVDIVDDPHRRRGLRSKPFDGEGVANARRMVVEDGVLTSWILDLSTARQLGLGTTGHAARGTSAPPAPSVTNLHMAAGAISVDDMIAAVDSGFYVTELLGMGVNQVTGDYSRGAAGFWIERGEIAYPVGELTVAGNLKDMYARLTPADDLELRFGIDAPTLRVDGMTVAGS